MSANFFARAARPLGRSAKAAAPRPFSTSQFRPRHTTGNSVAADATRTWTPHGVFTIALTTGLLGWGLAAVSFGGWPGGPVMLLDSKTMMPRYASTHELELVRLCREKKGGG